MESPDSDSCFHFNIFWKKCAAAESWKASSRTTMFRAANGYIITILSVLIATIHAQQLDQAVCPEGPSSSIANPDWFPVPNRFEVIGELNDGQRTIEFSQAFALGRDAIATSSAEGSLRFVRLDPPLLFFLFDQVPFSSIGIFPALSSSRCSQVSSMVK